MFFYFYTILITENSFFAATTISLPACFPPFSPTTRIAPFYLTVCCGNAPYTHNPSPASTRKTNEGLYIKVALGMFKWFISH